MLNNQEKNKMKLIRILAEKNDDFDYINLVTAVHNNSSMNLMALFLDFFAVMDKRDTLDIKIQKWGKLRLYTLN